FERVREARTVVVAFVRDEDLRFAAEAAEGAGVDDAVPVALERRARFAFRFFMQAPTRAGWVGRIGRARRADERRLRLGGLFHCFLPVSHEPASPRLGG